MPTFNVELVFPELEYYKLLRVDLNEVTTVEVVVVVVRIPWGDDGALVTLVGAATF